MALTSAQELRLRLQDLPVVADNAYTFDGTGSAFALPHRNLTSATAYVPVAAGWSATGAAFSPSGYVTFSGVGSANSAFKARYVHSVFSDDEVDHRLTTKNSVNGAALEFVTDLMFDGLKRARWSSPDGTSYDDTAAMGLLKELYKTLKEEVAETEIGQGDMPSWSLNQELY